MTKDPSRALLRALLGIIPILLATTAPCQVAASLTVPAPHGLSHPIATSPMTFGSVTEMRQLTDGRLLVNDPVARTITLLDSMLARPVVLLDSAGGRNNSYGAKRGKMIPFLGDSTLFYDAASNVLLVIDPAGRLARVMATFPSSAFVPAAPRGSPVSAIRTAEAWAAAIAPQAMLRGQFSARLGLIVNSMAGDPSMARFASRLPPGDTTTWYRVDDSVPIMTMHLATRSVDTVGAMFIGVRRVQRSAGTAYNYTDAFPTSDLMAVTSDGSVAIVRTREYRVDWIGGDGAMTPGSRLPFPWRRVPEDEKPRIADSVGALRRIAYEARLNPWLKDSIDAAQGRPLSSGAMTLGVSPRAYAPLPTEPADVADYEPALRDGATLMADADNNIWIGHHAFNLAGSPIVYDVVSREGRIIDRVQLPPGRTVAGFGRNGIVYLLAYDAGRVTIEKTRVH